MLKLPRTCPGPCLGALVAAFVVLPACAAAPPLTPASPATPPARAAAAVASAKAPLPTGPYDVIIVGAGISGLAAARELRHLDPAMKILVLEATNHVGGRGYTHTMASGTPIDLGGAWVHGVPTNPLTSLVDRLSFTRVKTDLSTPFYTSHGLASPKEQGELRAAIEQFEKQAEAAALRVQAESVDQASRPPSAPAALPTGPVKASAKPPAPGKAASTGDTRGAASAEKCQEHPTGDRASDYLPCGHEAYFDLVRANSGPLESTAELEDSSTVDVSDFEAGEDDLVTQGMGEFVKAFGQEMIGDPKVPLNVRLEAPVTRVKYDDRGVSITTSERGAPQTYQARRVLVTVSTGVLQRDPEGGGIAFDPPLPGKKMDAIKGLPMGLMNKIILEFPSDVFGAEVSDNSWVLYQGDTRDEKGHREVMAFALKPFGSKRIAVGFVGGDRARKLEAGCKPFVESKALVPEDPRPHACDAPAIEAAKDALRKMFPRSPFGGKEGPAVYMTRWGLVSWTRGSYSAALPGKWMSHEELGKPVPFPTALYAEERIQHGDAPVEGEEEQERRYRVFFAGEGCARPIYNGSFPGAYESGVKAARALANSLAADPPAK